MPFRRYRGYARRMPYKRQLDKRIETINNTTATTTQVENSFYQPGFPVSLSGLDVNLTTSGSSAVFWAVVLVKDGQSASTLGITDAGNFYTPEDQVLISGVLNADSSGAGADPHIHEKVNSKRRMMPGDSITFIYRLLTATSTTISGQITLWAKV